MVKKIKHKTQTNKLRSITIKKEKKKEASSCNHVTESFSEGFKLDLFDLLLGQIDLKSEPSSVKRKMSWHDNV